MKEGCVCVFHLTNCLQCQSNGYYCYMPKLQGNLILLFFAEMFRSFVP